ALFSRREPHSSERAPSAPDAGAASRRRRHVRELAGPVAAFLVVAVGGGLLFYKGQKESAKKSGLLGLLVAPPPMESNPLDVPLPRSRNWWERGTIQRQLRYAPRTVLGLSQRVTDLAISPQLEHNVKVKVLAGSDGGRALLFSVHAVTGSPDAVSD